MDTLRPRTLYVFDGKVVLSSNVVVAISELLGPQIVFFIYRGFLFVVSFIRGSTPVIFKIPLVVDAKKRGRDTDESGKMVGMSDPQVLHNSQ